MRGKRVLELGSGVGYLGLVIAAIQLDTPDQENTESSIWLTDVNDFVLSRCRDNLDLPCSTLRRISDELEHGYTLSDASSRHQRLQLRQLDWFSALDTDGISSIRGLMAEADQDVIVGADIVEFSSAPIITDRELIRHTRFTIHPLSLPSLLHSTWRPQPINRLGSIRYPQCWLSQ